MGVFFATFVSCIAKLKQMAPEDARKQAAPLQHSWTPNGLPGQ